MPKVLQGEARAEWRRVVPELERMGLLARVDRAALVRYCILWADWLDLTADLSKTGRLIRGRPVAGQETAVRNPLWLLRNDVTAALLELGKQLGLNPVSRLRAGIVHDMPDEEDDSEEITAIDGYRARLSAL